MFSDQASGSHRLDHPVEPGVPGQRAIQRGAGRRERRTPLRCRRCRGCAGSARRSRPSPPPGAWWRRTTRRSPPSRPARPASSAGRGRPGSPGPGRRTATRTPRAAGPVSASTNEVVVADLVPEVAEQGAVRLVHRDPQLLPVHVVALGQVQGDHAVVVPGHDLLVLAGQQVEAEPALRVLDPGR